MSSHHIVGDFMSSHPDDLLAFRPSLCSNGLLASVSLEIRVFSPLCSVDHLLSASFDVDEIARLFDSTDGLLLQHAIRAIEQRQAAVDDTVTLKDISEIGCVGEP